MRHIIILVATLLLSLCAKAQNAEDGTENGMRRWLSNVPDMALVPYLSHNDLLDCIDYREAGIDGGATSRFGAQVRLTELASDYALLAVGDKMTLELQQLPVGEVGDSCIVAAIYTVNMDSVMRSRIVFFDDGCNRLPESGRVEGIDKAQRYHLSFLRTADGGAPGLLIHRQNIAVGKEEREKIGASNITKNVKWDNINQEFQ